MVWIVNWEKINDEYLTRNYASIHMIIEHIQSECVGNTIDEIVSFIFQATSNGLILYQFPKYEEEEYYSKEIKLIKVDNPNSIAFKCISLAKEIPKNKNAYNWFDKIRPLNDITNTYWFSYDFLKGTDIAEILDIALMSTPMKEREHYSKDNYLTRKTLKNGLLIDELIFSKSAIHNKNPLTSHVKELEIISEQKEIINKLYDELSEAQTIHHEDGGLTIPFYFNDEEIKDLKFFAEKENLSEDEFIKKAINSELDEMHPILEFFNYYTQNNIKDKNITDLFNLINKTGESNKFYKALSKAGFVPKINQDEKGNFKDDLLKSLNQQLTAKDEQIAELQKQLNERLEAGTPAEPIADKELSPTAQTAVTKLLYSLFREHGYELDGKRKGATNDQLVTLTKSHKAEVSRDTIAHWLDRTNALQSDLQK